VGVAVENLSLAIGLKQRLRKTPGYRSTLRVWSSPFLSTSLRAAIAADIANMPKGRPVKKDANGHVKRVTRKEAATLMKVGVRAVARAAKIKREALE